MKTTVKNIHFLVIRRGFIFMCVFGVSYDKSYFTVRDRKGGVTSSRCLFVKVPNDQTTNVQS